MCAVQPDPCDPHFLTFDELVQVSFTNPLRALGLDPVKVRRALARKLGGRCVEYVDGAFYVRG